MKFLVVMSCLLGSLNFAAAEELRSTSLRQEICNQVIFDYYDYGEYFQDESSSEEAVNAECETADIEVTEKTYGSFPELNPSTAMLVGNLDVTKPVVTKMIISARFYQAFSATCEVVATRTLPSITQSFKINDEGEIVYYEKVVGSLGWSVNVEDCIE